MCYNEKTSRSPKERKDMKNVPIGAFLLGVALIVPGVLLEIGWMVLIGVMLVIIPPVTAGVVCWAMKGSTKVAPGTN